MVPKGPEWGGGNWEIKTPTTVKDIPQWELAAEVTPYMKTDDGTIPSIIVDHIGVYLGSIKGRGNIVEVREDSLVKAFMPAGNDNKVNGLEASLIKSISNQPNVGFKLRVQLHIRLVLLKLILVFKVVFLLKPFNNLFQSSP
jgi:hypothetical protein